MKVIRAGIIQLFKIKVEKFISYRYSFSGAMDNRNYLLANKLVGNELDLPVIEFAYQGPLLKYLW